MEKAVQSRGGKDGKGETSKTEGGVDVGGGSAYRGVAQVAVRPVPRPACGECGREMTGDEVQGQPRQAGDELGWGVGD